MPLLFLHMLLFCCCLQYSTISYMDGMVWRALIELISNHQFFQFSTLWDLIFTFLFFLFVFFFFLSVLISYLPHPGVSSPYWMTARLMAPTSTLYIRVWLCARFNISGWCFFSHQKQNLHVGHPTYLFPTHASRCLFFVISPVIDGPYG